MYHFFIFSHQNWCGNIIYLIFYYKMSFIVNFRSFVVTIKLYKHVLLQVQYISFVVIFLKNFFITTNDMNFTTSDIHGPIREQKYLPIMRRNHFFC